jgi:hypothetical protein
VLHLKKRGGLFYFAISSRLLKVLSKFHHICSIEPLLKGMLFDYAQNDNIFQTKQKERRKVLKFSTNQSFEKVFADIKRRRNGLGSNRRKH